MKISSRDRWVRLCGRLALALAAVALVPACDKEKTILGTPGPQGPAGRDQNPPAPWSEPVNISNQVVDVSSDAYGQQAVFTPDGRLHVVYWANDYYGTKVDQLYYTSAAYPYTSWDAPVRVTDSNNGPLGFDLAPAADGSAHIVFVRSIATGTELVYSCNTAGNRRTFTERRITQLGTLADFAGGGLLMRGSVAHVVFSVVDEKESALYHTKSTDGWPLIDEPTLISHSTRRQDNRCITFTSDSAGNFHLVTKECDVEYRYIYYRNMPVGADTFGDAELVNNYEDELISWTYEAPIVQFDGSNNVYVFWRRWDYFGTGNEPDRAVMGNIRSAAGTFQGANATVVTQTPQDDSIASGDYYPLFDVQVAADGRIHAVWKTGSSYGTNDLYPLYYRSKAPGLIPFTGWQDAEAVAWLLDPTSSNILGGGLNRTALVRPAGDGSVHVFFADNFGMTSSKLLHAYRPANGSTWYSTGSLSDPTTDSRYTTLNPRSYFLEAGIEEDGSPFCLFAVNPAFYRGYNGDLVYTHYWAGEWAPGVDVNGPNHADVYGSFWVGRDPQGRLHAIWQQEVDPFDNDDYYDLLHSNSPVVSDSFWAPEQEQAGGSSPV